MKLRLIELKIKDFAGIKKESFKFDGKDSKIYGDNATGKTTTAIALNWLLFDKGLEGQKIDIVPKDENNEHIHERVPTVEAVLDMNGTKLHLKRESHPNYEKVEGSTKKHYKNSRTTKQYIDEVPYPITKFKNAINDIIDEEVFKLVTNPDAFAQLHWQDKRKILFQIAGDLSDEDIINSNSELKDLLEIISKRDIEDEKKVINDQLKKAREDLEHIPVKINTLNEQLTNTELNESEIEKALVYLDTEIDHLKEKRTDIERSGAALEIKREIDDVEHKIKVLKRNAELEHQNKTLGIQKEINVLKNEIDDLEYQNRFKRADNGNLTATKDDKLVNYKHLTEEQERVQEEEFTNPNNDNCPLCGQPIPEHEFQEKVERAQSEFNKSKSVRLERLTQDIKSIVNQGKEITKKIDENDEDIKKTQSLIDKNQKTLDKITHQLKEINSEQSQIEDSAEYKKLLVQKSELESSLKDEKSLSDRKTTEITSEISDKENERHKVLQQLSELFNQQRLKKSIANYRKEEESILDTIENLKYRKYLIEEFTKTKVNLITEKVNGMFEIARFKLFHQQVNGDISDTCQIMVNGVTYDGGLNNAMRINVGLDIIKTLSKHYKAEAMIFIDNAEAVTKLNDTDAQQIQLIVSKQDKKLRLEV